MANFSYEFVQSVDNRYGIETVSGSWNGEFTNYKFEIMLNNKDCLTRVGWNVDDK